MSRPSLGEHLCQKRHDYLVIQECGISVASDGSEDSQINIAGIEDYKVGESEEEATDDEC